ncbi:MULTISPECIES: TraC family protein [unclassified Ensifer]|uniref:TraC family protein n=1 Tax=unclassified Ensifer TaxID=2633371 RepID=UPI000812F2B7|nr:MULTISPECIES: TraC family protein [unclassified Ensifer]OCP21751.1 pilus assembly protein [Ensifer sp. LC384]OCP22708.1 pilus assembly protein [Ensifer sp. LC54]OCP37428.1 pilus assembly protein [Ensifer sp. LC163]
MRAKTTISEIDAQIETLRARRKSLLVKAGERFARVAQKAGLAELDIPDSELDAIFAEIVARFRERVQQSAGPTA